MERYARFVILHRKVILIVFALAAAVCALLSVLVETDYDFVSYLPEDADSVAARTRMEEEYGGTIPNLRVMVYDVTIPEALEYKALLKEVEGVEEILWLDDVVEIYEPLEMADEETVDAWYRDGTACYILTITDGAQAEAAEAIREIIGEENCLSGTAAETAAAPSLLSAEGKRIALLAGLLLFLLLLLVTRSWIEPLLLLISLGVTALLHMGTNLAFGTVSYITNVVSLLLQLVISLGYSVFLLDRYDASISQGEKPEQAMILAVRESAGSLLFRTLAVSACFLALVFTQLELGAQLGLAMAKAVVLGLLGAMCLLPALIMASGRGIDKTRHSWRIRVPEPLARAVVKARVPVLLLAVLLVPVCYLAQKENSYVYGTGEIYTSDETRLGRDTAAIEEVFGTFNPVVILVPATSVAAEAAMNGELSDLDCVTSVISYANDIGSEIPRKVASEDTLTRLVSVSYSRFILTLEAGEGEEDREEQGSRIRNVAEKYYGDEALLAGTLFDTLELKDTITQDSARVTALAAMFVFLLLLFHYRRLLVPILMMLAAFCAIWINLAVPYFQGDTLYGWIGLLAGVAQLAVTIDGAVLFTDRYLELRKQHSKREAVCETVQDCGLSVMIPSLAAALAGGVLGVVSTNGMLSQFGILLARGAVLSLVLVLLLLPALLLVCDGVISRKGTNTGQKR